MSCDASGVCRAVAQATILGLNGSKNNQCEIPLSKLEEMAAKGFAPLVDFLNEETGRSEKTLARLLKERPLPEEHALLTACGQSTTLAKRVQPFAAILRTDSFDRLVVISRGSVYATAGTDRRGCGTHYTPRSLTEPIVDPLPTRDAVRGRANQSAPGGKIRS
jgi:hypothetical protein